MGQGITNRGKSQHMGISNTDKDKINVYNTN